ncbi:MAG: hypothetical protein VW946_00440 [Gammaproteobacteria bacterium]
MTKLLAFDSMYMLSPIRKIYMTSIRRIFNKKKIQDNKLVLYRLDRNNILIREEQNISGMSIDKHKDSIESLSIKFYKHLRDAGICDGLMIKNLKIYDLYTRQVKLKLAGLLRCAYRIQKLSIESEGNILIITDRQTMSIMKETFSFLKHEPSNIIWKTNILLTCCVTVNSLLMRAIAIVRMIVVRSDLPKYYIYKVSDSNLPTVLITMPKRRPEDFFSTYVKKFESQFNLVIYSLGFLKNTPDNYRRIKIKRKPGFLKGLFNIKNISFTAESYIADVLLIFKKHYNLSRSIDVVNSVFSNKIDAHVSRLQTNVADNYLAIEAKRREVFILGDVMEEIFQCDAAICSSASENTEPFRLSIAKEGDVTYKGNNSLINYRLKNFIEKRTDYLNCILGLNDQIKIIFYASDPSKEESQRYLTEKFLVECFSHYKNLALVIKTHPQDNGKITNYAYLDSKSPCNVFLIGDIAQKGHINSSNFQIFEQFDFNAAISSSDGFLTSSSSSILQALMLGIKAGIVDNFANGYYDYLVSSKAAMLVNSKESLQDFIEIKHIDVTDEILSYCGLKNNNKEFDVGRHLLKCLKKID